MRTTKALCALLAAALPSLGFCADRFDARAAELVAKLTLEEKAAFACYRQPAVPRFGIPEYNWWNEALHGVARAGLATVFPQAIGRAATFDAALEERIGRVVATEARAKYNLLSAKGMRKRYCNVNLLSPNVNMFRDPRWGRGQETYGEDPFLTGTMGGAYVRGIQAKEGGLMKACACAKHFAVHSGPEAGRTKFSVGVSERDLREYYLPAFRMLVEDAGVETVMTAYNALNGAPMTANKRLLTDILRGEWGFRGAVVSDAGATRYLVTGHHLGDEVESVSLASQAGLDLGIDLINTNLAAAVRSGRIRESDLDRQLARLLALRMRMGLLTLDGRDAFGELGAKDVASPEHNALARLCAEKSIVLVANRNGALPLDRAKTRAICVAGPYANDAVALYGNYNGYPAKASCMISGFAEEAGPGILVRDRFDIGEGADVGNDAVFACLGITAAIEGEGKNGDRKSYSVDATQLDDLRRIRKLHSGTLVAVVFGGSPVDLQPLEEICDAVLLAWYPGEEGGRAVARVAFGEVNPAGRLPITFPKSYDDVPPFEDYAVAGRTYRYSDKVPLHPFGYGLSYTTFGYSDASWDGTAVSVRVTNTGKRDGEEVVQVYLKSPAECGDRRRHHLVGFRRVPVRAGDSTLVRVPLSRRAFEVFDADGKATCPKGRFTAYVGGGQPECTQGVTIVVEQVEGQRWKVDGAARCRTYDDAARCRAYDDAARCRAYDDAARCLPHVGAASLPHQALSTRH